MIQASLILSIAFLGCMCVVLIAGRKGDAQASPVEYKQPDIHIHNNNNSHGGNSNSYSHGGTSASDSDGYGGQSDSHSRGGNSDSCSKNTNSNKKNSSISTTEDNISEQIIQDHINKLREELANQQQLDVEMLEQLIKLEQLANKNK